MNKCAFPPIIDFNLRLIIIEQFKLKKKILPTYGKKTNMSSNYNLVSTSRKSRCTSSKQYLQKKKMPSNYVFVRINL